MRHRSPARWLAPLALVVCAVAAFAVVQDGSSSGDGGKTATTVTSESKSTGKGADASPSRRSAAAKRKRTYIVKSGDVLSSIAEAHGTTVEELQALNPSVDAATLHVGQKIRLPR
jgi:LysM repeat protein